MTNPEEVKSSHVWTLRCGFAQVNQSERDWNYHACLQDWDIDNWIKSMLIDAGTIESIVKNPEVSELTEKAITIFSAARMNYIDPTEFESVMKRLEEVLK